MSPVGGHGDPGPASAVWEHIRRGEVPTADRVAQAAGRAGAVLGADGADRLRERLHESVLGLGPLRDLVADPRVTDVLVNGDGTVWVDVGDGVRRSDVRAGDPATVRRLAVRLAGLAGQRLDASSPYVDGLLPDGTRLHAVLPPLVDTGPHLSLRVPRRVTPTLAELVELGAVSPGLADALGGVVRRKRAFLVSGGTGSGKTTLLGALLGEAAATERIVVVEDVRELAVRHPHVVRLQARSANVEGQGAVPLTALVRQCLRMRPDRIVVGEVRGAEVRDLLTALNTGHEGGCGTLHANSAMDAPARFEALGVAAGLSRAAVHSQLAASLDVVLHLGRDARARRRLAEVAVLGAGDDGLVRVLPALTFDADGGRPGPGHARLLEICGRAT